jgi:hypothetical protein
VQLILAFARVAMFVIMLATIAVAVMFSSPNSTEDKPFGTLTPLPHTSAASSTGTGAGGGTGIIGGTSDTGSTLNTVVSPPIWNADSIYLLLPIAAYAMIFHHSIPSFAQSVKEKGKIGTVLGTALLFCCVAYTLVGIVVSGYFGENTLVSSNLDWSQYVGSTTSFSTSLPSDATSMLSHIIRKVALLCGTFVVILPAFDVVSAFPLYAITLGNNFMSGYFGSKIHAREESRYTR